MEEELYCQSCGGEMRTVYDGEGFAGFRCEDCGEVEPVLERCGFESCYINKDE